MQADGEHSIQLGNLELHWLHVPFRMKNPTEQDEHTEKVHVRQLENLEMHGLQRPLFGKNPSLHEEQALKSQVRH